MAEPLPDPQLPPPRPGFFLAGGSRDSSPLRNGNRTSPMPRGAYHQVDSTDPEGLDMRTPSRSPSPSNGNVVGGNANGVNGGGGPLFQPSARPPPSSFAFPFQAYPGNPDPGMSIPGYPSYSRRRSSFDSISYRGAPTPSSDGTHSNVPLPTSPTSPTLPTSPVSPTNNNLSASLNRRRAVSLSDESLPPPNAPFMSDNGGGTSSGTSSEANSLHHSPSSNSLYKGSAAAAAASNTLPRNSSTHSFRTPFLSPASRPTSWVPPPHITANLSSQLNTPSASSTALALAYANGLPLPKAKPPQPSTRLTQPLTKEDKPWLSTREPRVLTSYLLTLLFTFLGLCGAAALCYFGYTSVPLLPQSSLCMVMNEDFSGGALNSDYWNVEVQTGGFGNGEFQMTTGNEENLFIRNGQLYMYPTLTTESLGIDIFDGSNFTLDGCTAEEDFTSYVGPAQGSVGGSSSSRLSCSASANRLVGSVIPPVVSARINTKRKKSIRYGKVEIRAKLPRGDWLWPAIWMLPEENKYGKWPMSGEIDILEARGNPASYPAQGSTFVRSSLNFGPLASLYTQLYGWQERKRDGWDKSFHTYTLEWTPDFIRMFVDKRTVAMLEVKGLRTKKNNFFTRSKYPQVASNWSLDNPGNGDEMVVVKNIWEEAGGELDAPFDQPFFLIMNLAVGGTSGWFPDSKGGKPWYDESQTAMRDFANAQDTWSKTWPASREERSFRIDSVKMWEMCRKR